MRHHALGRAPDHDNALVGAPGLRTLSLLPANEAWRDPSREILDGEVLCSWLELHETVGTTENELLDSLRVLRTQWCEEPSVHGGKDARPSQ